MSHTSRFHLKTTNYEFRSSRMLRISLHFSCAVSKDVSASSNTCKNSKVPRVKVTLIYRIYSINRHGRLLNFWTLKVGAYSRWALIRGLVLIKSSPFSASVVCLFCNNTINGNNKTRRCNKARFL